MWYKNPLLWLSLIQRVASVFLIQTSYAPDEYWQSLEVAHKLAFGYGYLTWEWTTGIRSYLYPVLIAWLYKGLEFFNVDSVENLIILPRLAQALASTVADYYFVKWYQKTTGRRPAWAWFSILTSWFWMYCASRTLANTIETVFTTLGLYFYPWSEMTKERLYAVEKRRTLSFLWFVGLACLTRPTAFIIWLPLCLLHVLQTTDMKRTIVKQYLPIGFLLFTLSTMLDSSCHGKLVFTWWNFLHANIFKGVGDFYGTNIMCWYFISGLPVVLGLHLVPFIFGCHRLRQYSNQVHYSVDFIIFCTILWTIIILSLIPHKEFRFLLPILPMCLHISTSWLALWSRRTSHMLIIIVSLFFTVACITPVTYTGYYHQRGVLDVMPVLARIAKAQPEKTSLLFLMPCHSTPLYSHLHVNVSTRFLTCTPDFSGNSYYTDEADIFYQQPQNWLKQQYPKNRSDIPSHIICFDNLVPEIIRFLNTYRFVLHSEIFHTFHPEGRVGKHVLIYERF